MKKKLDVTSIIAQKPTTKRIQSLTQLEIASAKSNETIDPKANLASTKMDDIFEEARLEDLNPTKDFSEQDLSGSNLRNKNFSNSILIHTRLNGSELIRARLNGAIMSEAQLRGANLTEANLCGTQLPDADLNGASLKRADLRGADLRRAELRNANLSDANLSGANVEGAKFGGCIGLSDDTKRDLKKRGAIFKDSATEDNSLVEEKKGRWIIQSVIVPLFAALISGAIAAIIAAEKNQHPSPPTPIPTIQPSAQGTPSQKTRPTTSIGSPLQ